jgi:hypothetical protein
LLAKPEIRRPARIVTLPRPRIAAESKVVSHRDGSDCHRRRRLPMTGALPTDRGVTVEGRAGDGATSFSHQCRRCGGTGRIALSRASGAAWRYLLGGRGNAMSQAGRCTRLHPSGCEGGGGARYSLRWKDPQLSDRLQSPYLTWGDSRTKCSAPLPARKRKLGMRYD